MAERRKGNGGKRGNSYDRRERKLWLLGAKYSRKYGMAPYGGNGTHVPCVHCGRLLDLATCEADRIVPGALGGTYVYSNVQPSCRMCNIARGCDVGV